MVKIKIKKSVIIPGIVFLVFGAVLGFSTLNQKIVKSPVEELNLLIPISMELSGLAAAYLRQDLKVEPHSLKIKPPHQKFGGGGKGRIK